MDVFGFVKRVFTGLLNPGTKGWRVGWRWELPTFSKKKERRMPRSVYFSDDEVKGLDQELVAKLDMARKVAGIPFIITCGVRTKEENDLVGGVSDSAHLTGKAVDLRCEDSTARFKMVSGLLSAGFKRVEVASAHIHVDVDEDKPQYVMWLGLSK